MMTDDNVRCDNEDYDWDDEDKRKEPKQRMNFEEGEILLRLSNLDKYIYFNIYEQISAKMYNKAKVINLEKVFFSWFRSLLGWIFVIRYIQILVEIIPPFHNDGGRHSVFCILCLNSIRRDSLSS